jgi:hypothetical protein
LTVSVGDFGGCYALTGQRDGPAGGEYACRCKSVSSQKRANETRFNTLALAGHRISTDDSGQECSNGLRQHVLEISVLGRATNLPSHVVNFASGAFPSKALDAYFGTVVVSNWVVITGSQSPAAMS